MKRLLVLALVLACAPLWADGGWDLTKPANNGYVASFPAEVRANQMAIVASLTPPIEWTGEVTQYGRPSARLGFDGLTGSFRYPTFWLGSIGTAAAYIFGPSEQVPVGIPGDDAPGWYAHIASYPSGDPGEKCYLQLGMPNGNGTAQAVGILIREDLIFVNRKISGVATGTAAQDAVNLGQMNAAVDSVQVIAQSAPNTPVSEVLDEFYYVDDGAGIGMLATFSYEMVDTHGAWSGATFTAPLDGVYEITVSMLGYNSEESPSWTRIRTDNLGGTEVASAPFFLAYEQMTSYDYFMLTGTNYIPMDQGNTFCVFIQTSGTNVFTVARDSRIIRIRKIADLP